MPKCVTPCPNRIILTQDLLCQRALRGICTQYIAVDNYCAGYNSFTEEQLKETVSALQARKLEIMQCRKRGRPSREEIQSLRGIEAKLDQCHEAPKAFTATTSTAQQCAEQQQQPQGRKRGRRVDYMDMMVGGDLAGIGSSSDSDMEGGEGSDSSGSESGSETDDESGSDSSSSSEECEGRTPLKVSTVGMSIGRVCLCLQALTVWSLAHVPNMSMQYATCVLLVPMQLTKEERKKYREDREAAAQQAAANKDVKACKAVYDGVLKKFPSERREKKLKDVLYRILDVLARAHKAA